MEQSFKSKNAARETVWREMERQRVAAFPFPPRGRIPNFKGAGAAARRLFDIPNFAEAKVIKVNPDSAQRPVRAEALRRGIVVYVPTPRLAGGFMKLDPARIPLDRIADATTMSKCAPFAETMPLRRLPQFDAIVCGSVAVTRGGFRCGKGAGFADLELAILAELGQCAVPVATTVHPLQIVGAMPQTATDLPLSYIVTPDKIFEVAARRARPRGVDWALLDEAALAAMPVLAELKRLKAGQDRVRRFSSRPFHA